MNKIIEKGGRMKQLNLVSATPHIVACASFLPICPSSPRCVSQQCLDIGPYCAGLEVGGVLKGWARTQFSASVIRDVQVDNGAQFKKQEVFALVRHICHHVSNSHRSYFTGFERGWIEVVMFFRDPVTTADATDDPHRVQPHTRSREALMIVGWGD